MSGAFSNESRQTQAEHFKLRSQKPNPFWRDSFGVTPYGQLFFLNDRKISPKTHFNNKPEQLSRHSARCPNPFFQHPPPKCAPTPRAASRSHPGETAAAHKCQATTPTASASRQPSRLALDPPMPGAMAAAPAQPLVRQRATIASPPPTRVSGTLLRIRPPARKPPPRSADARPAARRRSVPFAWRVARSNDQSGAQSRERATIPKQHPAPTRPTPHAAQAKSPAILQRRHAQDGYGGWLIPCRIERHTHWPDARK